MIRTVLDTNVLVSGLLKPSGLEQRVLRLGLAQVFEMLVSPAILAEYEGVLRRPRFRLTSQEVAQSVGIVNARQLIEILIPKP